MRRHNREKTRWGRGGERPRPRVHGSFRGSADSDAPASRATAGKAARPSCLGARGRAAVRRRDLRRPALARGPSGNGPASPLPSAGTAGTPAPGPYMCDQRPDLPGPASTRGAPSFPPHRRASRCSTSRTESSGAGDRRSTRPETSRRRASTRAAAAGRLPRRTARTERTAAAGGAAAPDGRAVRVTSRSPWP